MKKTFKRLGIILFVCIMCFTSSIASFAGYANDSSINEIDNQSISTYSLGSLLYSKGKNFTESCTITITTTSANWSADFVLTVSENSSANYFVTMVEPDGTSHTGLVGGGGGSSTFTLTYAPAGTYTFIFTKNTGVTKTATAFVQIYD